MQSEGANWHEYLAPLGIPILIIADNPDLLATASVAFANWKEGAGCAEPTIELRLGLGTTSSRDVSCDIRVEGSRLTMSGATIQGYADAVSKQAACIVPPILIGNPEALAANVIDTLLLFLLARSGRTPVHAAGIVAGDQALVLAGRSGSGKSTLALAAAAAGLHVLSDDTIYVQTKPRLRVWGFPRPVHVFPEDAPAGAHRIRLRGGKLKVAVALDECRAPLAADKAQLILLAKGDRLKLEPIAAAEAVAGLGALEPGFDLLADESLAAIGSLAAGGAWRLTVARDPAAAIALLRERFGAGEPRL